MSLQPERASHPGFRQPPEFLSQNEQSGSILVRFLVGHYLMEGLGRTSVTTGRSKCVGSLWREVPGESEYQTSTGDTVVVTLREGKQRQASPRGCRLPRCPTKLGQTAWLITKSDIWQLTFGRSKTCPPPSSTLDVHRSKACCTDSAGKVPWQRLPCPQVTPRSQWGWRRTASPCRPSPRFVLAAPA